MDVFDLESYYADPSSNGTWYQQNTTGDIPRPRIDYCTVTAAAPDNSSHHIYLYGGVDPINNEFYDDVVILSIPSFTWTSVWKVGETPRYGHNCHRAGKRQIITVGGKGRYRCDWEKKGLAFLDLTTLAWGSVFNGEQPDYTVPQNVWDATNGNGDGKATIGEPKQGWTEEGLGQVFRKSRYTIPSTWDLSSEPKPDVPDDEKQKKKKKTSVGVIAGSVIGGLIGVSLIARILFIIHCQRVQTRKSMENHSDEDSHSRDSDSDGNSNGDEGEKTHELPGANLVELAGPEAAELNAPRVFAEADPATATRAAELPGTNTVPGGVHGVPIVRTPGDDLPELPEYTPGLKRSASSGSGRRRRRSSTSSTSSSSSSSSSSSTSSRRSSVVKSASIPKEQPEQPEK